MQMLSKVVKRGQIWSQNMLFCCWFFVITQFEWKSSILLDLILRLQKSWYIEINSLNGQPEMEFDIDLDPDWSI